METVRSFIAIDIGDEMRERLDELQRKLKKVHANVRWVKLKSVHLTLAFLGDVPPEKIDPLKAALDHTCRGIRCFELKVTGTGTFGRSGHPRVIWAGIGENPDLLTLQKKISDSLLAVEVDIDRKPFFPHLTLGRVKAVDRHIPSLLKKLENYAVTDFGSISASGVELMKSDLTPRGADYAVLHSSPLS